ncbi:unnamed protein product [Ixodes pacificus]
MFDCCLKSARGRQLPKRKDSKMFRMARTGRPPSMLEFSAAKVLERYNEQQEKIAPERPYFIRAIRPEELEQAFKIRQQTNYVFSKASMETAWRVTPDYFLAAVNAEGELFGTVSMVHYADGVVYMGLLAVKPELRGQRIAAELLAAAFEKAEEYNMYMRCALTLEPLFNKMEKFMIRAKVLLGRNAPVILTKEDLRVRNSHVTVNNFKETLLGVLCRYDIGVVKVDRSILLQATIDEEGALTKVAFGEDGKVVGYCVVQEMSDGSWCFYQLSADDRDIARMLIRSFVDSCPMASNVGVVLICPLWPDEEHNFLHDLGWKVKSRSVCRFSSYEIDFDYSRIYSM